MPLPSRSRSSAPSAVPAAAPRARGGLFDGLVAALQRDAATFAARGGSEALHRLRVDLGRLRVFVLGRGEARDAATRALTDALRRWRRALAEARDWDVFLQDPAWDDVDAPALRRRALARRRLALREARRVAASLPGSPLLADLQAFAHSRRTAAGSAAEGRSRRLIAGVRRAVVRRGRHPLRQGPRRQHRLRCAAKRLRYAEELFEVPEPPRDRLIARLRRLEAVLGAMQDARVAQRLVAALADGGDARERAALRRLAARERARIADRRTKLRKAWRRLRRLL